MEAEFRSAVIEEDLQVLDTESRELAPRASELLAHRPGDMVAEEVRNCVIRTRTRPAHTASDLRSGLLAVREGLRRVGEPRGLTVAAAGAVPLVPPGSALVDESPQMRRLLADYEFLARGQIYCGSRVRVDA
ncbi:glutamate-cysteine ligase family protein, partial [Dietzia sp. DQ12-76]